MEKKDTNSVLRIQRGQSCLVCLRVVGYQVLYTHEYIYLVIIAELCLG